MTQKPTVFVLFGATGDLAQKKVMPALMALFSGKKLGEGSSVIAFSRRDWNDTDYREFIRPSLISKADVDAFLATISYVQGTFDDAASYRSLKDALTKVRAEASYEAEVQVVFFLAVQPSAYASIAKGLGDAGLSGDGELLMIEKPFGTDAISARELEHSIRDYFPERQIVHVDHYLAKPAVTELFARRRDDPAFEERLSNAYVSGISVRMLESLDIQDRGEFYDATGAFRDVVQNHLLEILATLLAALTATDEGLPHARAEALAHLDASHTRVLLKGQYEGYRDTPDVNSNSTTETYIKISTASLDSRWSGIPILLEAGKSLPEKKTCIQISYKDGMSDVIDIDHPAVTRDAYEVAIEGAIAGLAWLFPSYEEIAAAWEWATPLLRQIQDAPLVTYPQGTLPVN